MRLRNLVRTIVRRGAKFLPSPWAEQLAWEILRATSSEWCAYTDLVVTPFEHRKDWKSGLEVGVHVLYGLVRAACPEVVVEIGSARGRSTCAMALACRQNGRGKVYAIDPHTDNAWSEGY